MRNCLPFFVCRNIRLEPRVRSFGSISSTASWFQGCEGGMVLPSQLQFSDGVCIATIERCRGAIKRHDTHCVPVVKPGLSIPAQMATFQREASMAYVNMLV